MTSDEMFRRAAEQYVALNSDEQKDLLERCNEYAWKSRDGSLAGSFMLMVACAGVMRLIEEAGMIGR